jgi:hypothetical protein
LRTLTEALATLDPAQLGTARYVRTQRKDRESYTRRARGLSVEEATQKIGDPVWSLVGHEPPTQFLIDQGRYRVEIGLAVPTLSRT